MNARDPLGDALELRAIRIGFLLHTAAAIILCFIPLFNVLGFERALVSGLLASPISAAVGISMVKSARLRGGDDLARIASHATGLSLLMLVPTMVAGVIVELIDQPCDQEQGILFLVLIAGGNALFGAALGVASATITRRRFFPGVFVAIVLATYLGVSLYGLYSKPQIFIFNLPFGYWPGSLYDEELTVTGALWTFRGYTLLVALSLVAVARMFAQPGTLEVRLTRPRATALLATSLLMFAAVTVHQSGESLGIELDRGTIERALSRHVQTKHFDIYIAPTVTAEQVELIKEDHELRHMQLVRFFGVAPNGRIKSFMYSSEKQKRRLMGAAQTQIARPWAKEIHINGFEIPHPVLKHELAHVFAGTLSDSLFKVPASAVIFVNIGVVEGIAVAADWPANELSVHGWTRAMRHLQLAPDLRTMLDVAGFWSISSARAYTVAGSFIRFLVDHFGMEKFGKLYASNSFEKAYGRPLGDLVTEWEKFIDETPLSKDDLLIAEHRFKRPGIFQKVCAHRAANLSKQGYERLTSGDLDGGIEDLEELIRYSPNSVQPLVDISRALAQNGRVDDARRYAKRALETPDITQKSAAEAREAIAGLDWRSGEVELAKKGYEDVLALHLSTASDRLQLARLSALTRSEDELEVLRPFLLQELSGAKALVKLGALVLAHPEDGLLHYLYGRQLESAGAYEEGIVELRAAITQGLGGPALLNEAEMTLGRLLLRAGQTKEAKEHFEAFGQRVESPVMRLQAEDWAERAAFALKPVE